MKTMSINRKKYWFLLLLSVGLLGILAACGTNPSLAATPLATQGNNSTPALGNVNLSSVKTVTMPPTQTNCPTTGTARAWVTARLALGKHANLVYSVNEYKGNIPTFGTLKRYDLTTRSKTEIVKIANVSIDDAQVSADGQWILFESRNNKSVEKLQVVRMDGQGLQTLYCSSTIVSPQWSTNQKLIAVTQSANGKGKVLFLHTSNGALETVFTQATNTSHVYQVRTWLDNTHLYLVRETTDSPPDELAILDTNKGANQTVNDLITVVHSGGNRAQMNSFDSSYDGSQLFVDHHHCAYNCNPPSDITVQPALGGTEHIIFHSATLSITDVRAVTPNTLLLSVNSYDLPGGHPDTSKNGLWSVHTDGTKLTRLTTDGMNENSAINNSSQFPWSNASRDGRLYATTQYSNEFSHHPTNAILIGSLNGGTPTTIASIADGTSLIITGWTTM
ncbi:MAG: hypothetical protein NVS4B1_02050 [Ktedonobacteraceae bacterium]